MLCFVSVGGNRCLLVGHETEDAFDFALACRTSGAGKPVLRGLQRRRGGALGAAPTGFWSAIGVV